MNRHRFFRVCGILALGICLTSGSAATTSDAAANEPIPIAGFYLPVPIELRQFKLIDHHGRAFTRTNLEGRWTLLFFGYTHCPDVCPATLAQLRDVKRRLAARQVPAQIDIVFVSVDPQRDTPARLADYIGAFRSKDFHGVTGSAERLAQFAAQFRAKFAIAAGGEKGFYTVDHTSTVALITPDASLRAVFTTPLRPERVATDLERILGGHREVSRHE